MKVEDEDIMYFNTFFFFIYILLDEGVVEVLI